MMLGAYGSKDVGKLTAEEYEWSEIFRVARRASRSFLFEDSGKSVSHFDPELYFSVYEVQPASRRLLKLPQIDTERAKICRTHQAYGSQLLPNEQLKSIKNTGNDQKNSNNIISDSGAINLLQGLQSHEVFDDTENTGLVIKLPEIANDVVRVAQES